MSENLNNNEGKNNPNDDEWDELTNASSNSAEQESQDAELIDSKKVEQMLKEVGHVILECFDSEDILSSEDKSKLVDVRESLERKYEELREKEAVDFLPESKREAFLQLLKEDFVSKPFAIEAVHMRAEGKTDEEIRDYIMSLDFGGADEEINGKRCDTIYQGIMKVIGENNEE